MTKNLDDIGLKSVADHYDLFFVDLWGVVHNGIELYKESINALEKLLDKNKDLVLLTNAPRPNNDVKNFLKKMGLEQIIPAFFLIIVFLVFLGCDYCNYSVCILVYMSYVKKFHHYHLIGCVKKTIRNF